MPFLCPCENLFTSLSLPFLIAKKYQQKYLVIVTGQVLFSTLSHQCYPVAVNAALKVRCNSVFRDLLKVPGQVRCRGGIWTQEIWYKRLCLELRSCWKMESNGSTSVPCAALANHLIIVWGPQSLNFHFKGDWRENSLKPQIVLYPLIYSVNFLPVTINMSCTGTLLGKRACSFSSEVCSKASWFRNNDEESYPEGWREHLLKVPLCPQGAETIP